MRPQHKQGRSSEILRQVQDELRDLGPYVYHRSYSTTSVYVKFADSRLRSLRIADHRGIKKYKYKWNIDIGGTTREDIDGGVRRFYFADTDLEAFFERIRAYSDTIQMHEVPLDIRLPQGGELKDC